MDLPVPTELALSIARRESEFNHTVGSPVGALGLMQLMPDTDRDRLATAIVDGIAAGKRHVLRPRRAFGLAKLVEYPRRAVEQVLAGVPARNG